MRPTKEYVTSTFIKYNELCFNNSLPLPEIKLGLRYGTMGMTRCEYDATGLLSVSIEISVRLDLPEAEYIDTIVHEMIHYYIAYNGLHDNSPHGNLFLSKMREIMDKTGIIITTAFDPSDEYLVGLTTHPRYVCVVELKDNQFGVMVVAKNKVFAFWDTLDSTDVIVRQHWFISNRAIWGNFPTSVTFGYTRVDADKLHHYLTGAIPLIREGNIISPKR